MWIAGQLLLREQYAQPGFTIHHIPSPHKVDYGVSFLTGRHLQHPRQPALYQQNDCKAIISTMHNEICCILQLCTF